MRASWFLCITFLSVALTQCTLAQIEGRKDITRIEFNSGSRTYRQQVIFTPDSVISIEEDFRVNLKPVVKGLSNSAENWNKLTSTLKDVDLEKVGALESPGNKRTYDAAAHGTIVITSGNKSYTHGFDDKEPNKALQPLMKQIEQLIPGGKK